MNSLSHKIYSPKESPKAIVQIIHGMGEYSDRYDEFAKYLCNKGYAVIIYDHRGHGKNVKSKDELGYFDDKDGWMKVVTDAHDITKIIKDKYKGDIPFILFGHSMGSIVARSYLKQYDYELDGLILCGAPNYNKLAPFGIMLSKLMGMIHGKKTRHGFLQKLTTGSFNKQIENPNTDSDWISKNEDNVKKYVADEMCNFVYPIQGYHDILWGMKYMNDIRCWKCTKENLPILFIVGSDDPCTGGKAGIKQSMDRLKDVGYKNIEKIIYDGLRHEILNEKENKIVFDDVANWLNEKIK